MPSTTTPSADAPRAAVAQSIHHPFSWLHDSLAGNAHAEFLALTRNICNGAAVIADVAHIYAIDQDTGETTVFSINDMERLNLMAASSLKLLAGLAEREIEMMNARALKEVAA